MGRNMLVGEIMRRDVVKVDTDRPIAQALEKQKAGTRRLTVADFGPKRVGMGDGTPLNDVARLVAEASVKGVPIVDGEGMPTDFVAVRELVEFISAQA